jgi:hypothetical protein
MSRESDYAAQSIRQFVDETQLKNVFACFKDSKMCPII